MTTLAEMIMECRAIKGMDKLVLYGWATQLEEGNDTLYCSKETVAEAIGVSDDTVLRRTQALVKAGWLIDTGEQKQWPFGWTPVRIINVPVIVGLVEAQCRKLRQVAECTPPQIAAQGSRFNGLSGFRFTGLSSSSSPSSASATGVPPVVAQSRSKEVEQTENLEPKTVEPKPTPEPEPHGQRKGKSCPDCGEPLRRGVNHFLSCPYAKGRSSLDEYQGDFVPMPKKIDPDDFDNDGYGYGGKPLFPSIHSKEAQEARQRAVDAEKQKSVESILEDGRARARAKALDNSPRSAAPPQASQPTNRCSACGGVEPCIDKWCYAYEPLPKSVDERPTGISS
ncbi:MAG: hypothetical protein WAM86_04500 [Candidatus Sulfotelmatobacter sp.]|jgi:hypothetical protein